LEDLSCRGLEVGASRLTALPTELTSTAYFLNVDRKDMFGLEYLNTTQIILLSLLFIKVHLVFSRIDRIDVKG
jgi:hypothetical protein